MKCSKAKRYLSAYIDKQLRLKVIVNLEKHLEICDNCKMEFDKLIKLNKDMQCVYEEVEVPEDFREHLINNVHQAVKLHNECYNVEENNKNGGKDYKKKLKLRKKLVWINNMKFKGIIATFILASAIFFVNEHTFFQWVENRVKGTPAYFINQQSFGNAEDAQKYIKGIPFLPPPYVIPGYKLKKITFTKTKDMKISVNFSYEDNNFNDLNIEYDLKGNDNKLNSSIELNPNCIKVNTSNSYSQPKGQPLTKESQHTELTQKSINVDLGKYIVAASIHYNCKILDLDKSGDKELAKIVESYLTSDINTIPQNQKSEIKYGTHEYSSFLDLKKDLPSSIRIIEPKYIPLEFKLKNIVYKLVNQNTKFFIINVVYEKSDKSLLVIDYRLLGKGDILKNNNGEIQTINAYKLGNKELDKTEFMPVIEKRRFRSTNNFDLNVFLQYDESNQILLKNADITLEHVFNSIN